MKNHHYTLIGVLLAFALAGCAVSSPTVASNTRNTAPQQFKDIDDSWPAVIFMSRGYWEQGNTFLLAKVTSFNLDNNFTYQFETLVDFRNNLKAGTRISVHDENWAGSFSTPHQLPNGSTVLIRIAPRLDKGGYCFDDSDCPIGWSANRVLRDDEIPEIIAAFRILRTVVPKKPSDPLDEEKANEFLKSTDYATFAIGASMISASRSENAVNMLVETMRDSDTTLSQGVWAMSRIKGMNTFTAMPKDLDTIFYDFVVARNPHFGDVGREVDIARFTEQLKAAQPKASKPR